VEGYNNTVETSTKTSQLPRLQSYFLLAVLIGYPTLSIVMSLLGTTSPTKITSRIEQIYLPALFLQAFILVAIWLVLRRTGARYADIGLGKDDITWSNALSGVIFFAGAWAVILVLRAAIQKSGYIPEKDFLYILPHTPGEKMVWIFLSLGAAFSEEICFRGFVVSRLRIVTGSWWPAAVLSSAAFSMGHLYQGLAGLTLTFVYGLLFVGLYVARKSVFPCIVAHFLQDVLVLAAFWKT